MMRRALIVVAAVALAGCGLQDAGTPTPGNGRGREGWYEIVDPETERVFRCFYWSLSDSTAFWRYDPDEADR
jgi:hypothetical protein